MSDVVITAEGLSKKYSLRHPRRERYTALRDVLTERTKAFFRPRRNGEPDPTREDFWALRDVGFEVKRGEVLGIIGRNGAGKSTLLKILSRITEPTTGRVSIKGRVASLLEVGTGFHPELTGRENIFLNGAILGMSRAEIKANFDEIVAFAEVEKFLDTPVKRYSSGMYVRLAFAVAAHLQPEILIIDEVLAVGDAQFQKKCLGKMENVSRQEGRTVLFVSHNMQAIRQLCRRVVLLDKGSLAFNGVAQSAITEYFGGSTGAGPLDLIGGRPTGTARLEHVSFLNGQGESQSEFSTSETLRVVIQFRLNEIVSELDIAIAIVHGDGTRVFSEVFSDQKQVPALAAGRYEVSFGLRLRYLKLESYFLTIYLLRGGEALDVVETIPLPTIVDPHADMTKETHRWGVARIPVDWSDCTRSEAKIAGGSTSV